MLSLKKVFSPGGKRFYDLFEEVGNNLTEMSMIFGSSIIEGTSEVRGAQLVQAFALEDKNDQVTHKLFIELGRNFITPFDREDIHTLVSTLDDIADHMYAIMKQINSYGITVIPHPTKNVAINLQKLVTGIARIIKSLQNKRHLEQLYPLCQEMKKIADLCATLTDAAVSRVYTEEQDPIEVVKRLDHYELVHTLVDRCYTVINVVESIIITYS